MKLIAVVGLARSGKDTVADILVNRYGFEHFDFFASVIRPLMEVQGRKPLKENAVKFGNEMRAKFGMGVFGEKMTQKIKGKKLVVVTGARSLEELKEVEKIAEHFHILKVSAPEEMRFARRSGLDPSEEKAFFERDENDLEHKGLERVLNAADFGIDNHGSLMELEEAVESVMERIK